MGPFRGALDEERNEIINDVAYMKESQDNIGQKIKDMVFQQKETQEMMNIATGKIQGDLEESNLKRNRREDAQRKDEALEILPNGMLFHMMLLPHVPLNSIPLWKSSRSLRSG